MSKIISLPALSMKLLNAITDEAKGERMGEDWYILNLIPKEEDEINHLSLFIFNYKAYRQARHISDGVARLHEHLVDFNNENFEHYIDQHNEWSEVDPESRPYDPYDDLRRCIDHQSVFDLPEKIGRYFELIEFCKIHGKRKAIMREGFKNFFPGLTPHILVTDEGGNKMAVPEDQVPADMLAEAKSTLEIGEKLESIEFEHAYDNYDAWIASITKMVAERRPFSEMLTLIKP